MSRWDLLSRRCLMNVCWWCMPRGSLVWNHTPEAESIIASYLAQVPLYFLKYLLLAHSLLTGDEGVETVELRHRDGDQLWVGVKLKCGWALWEWHVPCALEAGLIIQTTAGMATSGCSYIPISPSLISHIQLFAHMKRWEKERESLGMSLAILC